MFDPVLGYVDFVIKVTFKMYVEVLIIFLILLYVVMARTTYLLYQVVFDTRKPEEKRNKCDKLKALVVIGSGGHTSEMLSLVKGLDPNRYNPRTYIMSETDKWSEQRIVKTEVRFAETDETHGSSFEIVKIPRSREVHQSYLTSVFSTVYSTVHSVPILFRVRPDVVLCNGPGTCIPICVVAFFMRVLFLSKNRIVFIESVCRVKTLSLTGKILLFIADEILVQWPDLIEIYPRTKYIGRL